MQLESSVDRWMPRWMMAGGKMNMNRFDRPEFEMKARVLVCVPKRMDHS